VDAVRAAERMIAMLMKSKRECRILKIMVGKRVWILLVKKAILLEEASGNGMRGKVAK
jgi:hypothetical protein